MVVTLTGGERGDILNPAMDLPEVHGRITEVRRDEMAKAAEILGVEHHWLGFVDSGSARGRPAAPAAGWLFALVPLAEPVSRLVRVIREFQPHVLTTYDENGGYPHPDHIRCHEVSVAAYEAAADYRLYPTRARRGACRSSTTTTASCGSACSCCRTSSPRTAGQGPFGKWLEHWDPDHDIFANRVTTRVECSEYFSQRDDALRAHATQIDPKGDFFHAPIEWQQRLWADGGVRVGTVACR